VNKRYLVASLGVILIFSGVILASLSNSEAEVLDWVDRTEVVEKKYWIASYFSEGETVGVKFTVGEYWDFGEGYEPADPGSGLPYGHRIISFNVTDPYGDVTLFDIYFAVEKGYGIFKVTVYHPGRGVEASNSTGDFIWNTTASGVYNVSLWYITPPPTSLDPNLMEEMREALENWPTPPETLQLKVLEYVTRHPYQFMFFPGVSSLVIGGILSVVSFRLKSPTKPRKSKKIVRYK